MRMIRRFTAQATAWVAVAATLLFLACTRKGPVEGREVLFFPAQASVSPTDEWSLKIQGRIFEPSEQSAKRELLIKQIAAIGVRADDPMQSATLRERARFLLSDSDRRSRVSVRIDDRTIPLSASNSAGYFSAEIQLDKDLAAQLAKGGKISFESLPTKTNSTRFQGVVVLVPEEGVTVVTDMDDTLKITEVCDRKESLKNTLLRAFVPVPGMPALYRSWQEALGPRIHFHVVSAGPWQLHEPLRRFTESDSVGFPAFTWDMRSVDITNPVALRQALKVDPYDFKLGKITELMKLFPKRHFVLVGDSGEKDPEVYSKIASDFPERVDWVFIRDVNDKCHKTRSYEKLFPGKTAAKLRVFRNPSELPAALSPAETTPADLHREGVR